VLPGDTYRVAEVYVTTAHVSQLKSWKVFWEDEDDVPSEAETEDPVQPENENAVQEPVRAVRHEVEEEDGITTDRPVRTRRPPAHLSDYCMD